MRKNRLILKPSLKVEYKDDAIQLHHLIRFLLLALELADVEDKDEIEKVQKNFLDKH